VSIKSLVARAAVERLQSVGLPGREKSSVTPFSYAHRSSAFEINSGPLSTRMVLGAPPKAHYNRYVRWAVKGVWRDVFKALAAAGGPLSEVLIDSTHVKAHRLAAGGKWGSGVSWCQ
jgi:hypothetical protein